MINSKRTGKKACAEKYLSVEIESEVYKAFILPTSLCGCEAWSSREGLL